MRFVEGVFLPFAVTKAPTVPMDRLLGPSEIVAASPVAAFLPGLGVLISRLDGGGDRGQPLQALGDLIG